MSIQNKINTQMKEAMLKKEAVRLQTLRNIKTEFTKEMKVKGESSLSDEKSLKILRRLSKQRKEAADLYVKGGRNELADSGLQELAIIEEFLPQLASEEQVRVWVQEAIDSGVSNLGAVMGFVMRSHKDEVDGSMVRRLAQEML